jgi:3-methyl-2-oxobutanoate hydroxymethyltransferase
VSTQSNARSSAGADARRLTVRDVANRKAKGERVVMTTAYDALFARIVDEAGVDVILVGDSVGNVVAGFESTIPVTLGQMIYHAAAVRRGASRALLVIDMPFLTYQVTVERAVLNCGRAVQRSGVNAVKMEGAGDQVVRAVAAVVEIGVPVMGHLGFTPQSVNALGGFRVQARGDTAAQRLLDDARRLEDAGAFAVVLELVPADVAARVTEALQIPTIGIGAGPHCDGQVLVLHDLLGLNEGFSPKFLKRYAHLAAEVRRALREYGDDVRSGTYPADEHSF